MDFNRLLSSPPAKSGLARHFQSINERILAGMQLPAAVATHFASITIQQSSKNTLCSALKKAAVLTYADLYDTDMGVHNTIDNLFERFRKRVAPSQKGRVLTLQQLSDLIEFSGPKTSAWVEFLYYSGARINEAIHIRRVHMVGVAVNHGDEPLVEIFIEQAKADRPRYILVPKRIVDNVIHAFGGKTYLFETREGNKYRHQCVYNLITDVAKRILGLVVSSHDLRRTFATLMAEERPNLHKETLAHGGWSPSSSVYWRSYVVKRKLLNPAQIPDPHATQRGYWALHRQRQLSDGKPGNIESMRILRRSG